MHWKGCSIIKIKCFTQNYNIYIVYSEWLTSEWALLYFYGTEILERVTTSF